MSSKQTELKRFLEKEKGHYRLLSFLRDKTGPKGLLLLGVATEVIHLKTKMSPLLCLTSATNTWLIDVRAEWSGNFRLKDTCQSIHYQECHQSQTLCTKGPHCAAVAAAAAVEPNCQLPVVLLTDFE